MANETSKQAWGIAIVIYLKMSIRGLFEILIYMFQIYTLFIHIILYCYHLSQWLFYMWIIQFCILWENKQM